MRWLIAVALMALGISLMVLARDNSSSYQNCEAEQQANYASKEQPKGLAFVIKRVIAYHCTANFINTHNAVITAIATVLLTFVTGGLVFFQYLQIRTPRAKFPDYVPSITTYIINLHPTS